MSNPERLGIDIKVGVGGGSIEAKREMAVLATRLGITVHAELNDELCMACPGEEVARVYGKKRRDPQPCKHESRAANTDGDLQCRSCGLVEKEMLVSVPLVNADQLAVMRHAMQAGLRSVPVFARAFDMPFAKVEKVMAEIGGVASARDAEDRTAEKIAAWVEENPHGNSGVESRMLAEEIREGAWRE